MITLYRSLGAAGNKKIDTFETIEEAATFLYNTESRRDIDEAFGRGDFDAVCACGDFFARVED